MSEFPPELDVGEFRAAWDQWIADRKDRKLRPLTARGRNMQLRRLAPLGPAKAIACIELSIANGWQGLFPQHFAAGAKGGFKTHDDRVAEILFGGGDATAHD